jgi:hypothetical protein
MRTLLIACGAAVLCAGAAWSEEDVPIARAQVPPAVLAVMVKAAAPNELSDFVRGLEDGATVYSAEFTPAGGKPMEVTVAADASEFVVEAASEEPAQAAGAAPPPAPGAPSGLVSSPAPKSPDPATGK